MRKWSSATEYCSCNLWKASATESYTWAGSLATFQVGVGFGVLVPLTALVLWWSTRVYQNAIS